jgi:hypothetical protein
MTGIVYEATLGNEDGASRTVTIKAADEVEARKAVEAFLVDDEAVIFVEEAVLDDLTEDGLRDHPHEGQNLVISPSPKAEELE